MPVRRKTIPGSGSGLGQDAECGWEASVAAKGRRGGQGWSQEPAGRAREVRTPGSVGGLYFPGVSSVDKYHLVPISK